MSTSLSSSQTLTSMTLSRSTGCCVRSQLHHVQSAVSSDKSTDVQASSPELENRRQGCTASDDHGQSSWLLRHTSFCPATADERFATYNQTLRDIADQFAPERTVKWKVRPLSQWFDSECPAIRRNCRQLERRYRRTHSAADAGAYTAAHRHRSTVFKKKKEQY